jgi:putative ABC transport system permease protein
MDLSRVLDSDLNPVLMPQSGLVVDAYLAGLLGLERGDLVQIELLEGRRGTRLVPVADVVESYLGLVALMDLDALHEVAEGGPRLSGVHIAYDALAQRDLFTAIKATPAVGSIGLQRQAQPLPLGRAGADHHGERAVWR